MKVRDPFDQSLEPVPDLVRRQALRVLLEHAGQARAGDVFHDDEAVARVIGLEVVNRQQVRALEVHALHDPAAFDVEIAEDQLEGDFLARVGRGVIDLAESASADGSLDGVAIERAGSRAEGVAALGLGSGLGVGHVGVSCGLIGPGTRKVVRLVNGRFVHVWRQAVV